jgi:hypothetical protein
MSDSRTDLLRRATCGRRQHAEGKLVFILQDVNL